MVGRDPDAQEAQNPYPPADACGTFAFRMDRVESTAEKADVAVDALTTWRAAKEAHDADRDERITALAQSVAANSKLLIGLALTIAASAATLALSIYLTRGP